CVGAPPPSRCYTLSLHDALPILVYGLWGIFVLIPFLRSYVVPPLRAALGWTPLFSGVFYGSSLLAGGIILAIMIVPYIAAVSRRSEEHTSELQSRSDLVCRVLLE